MATFSLGVAPGAPGTYINETVGNIATAGIASFSTVYMLVETEESVPVANFPFNSPVMITSLNDYKALVGGVVPDTRIPLLSYNSVNAFFQNSQIGDLRVVRVGTPNQIVEIEILASGTRVGNSGLPTNLEAGDVVYAQIILNGLKLVAGDGSTGYSASGDWLGVPVTIPVDFIAGDAVNNRKISKVIAAAVSAAIESNPSVRSSVYVRDYGLVNELNPLSSSENAFISIAAATYDGTMSVVTQQNPVGSTLVLMNNTYDVQNIVGLQNNLVRLPQDYIQCINTAFDGQQDQGYLVTPTAYAQFDAAGRAAVGAAAAAHCQSNNFKWLALSDPGPYLVTDVNRYSDYTPHLPASDLVTGLKYLVDNAIYEWTGAGVTYDRLRHQPIIGGYSPKVAVEQSVEVVADNEKVGAIDAAVFTLSSQGPYAQGGKFIISSPGIWPAEFQVVEVNLSNQGADFNPLGDQAYVVAPPYDLVNYGPYPSNGTEQIVYLATSATAASNIYNEVLSSGGTSYMGTYPVDAFRVTSPTGSTADVSYGTPAWDLINQVSISGQDSNLIQNISGSDAYVNTVHLPGSLQSSTKDYRLGFTSRTFFNPSTAISSTNIGGNLCCSVSCDGHNLNNGQQVFFTNPVKYGSATVLKSTSVNGTNPYYVRVTGPDTFVLASSYSNYLAASYIGYPGAITTTTPTILYSKVTGGEATALNLSELSTIPVIRGRKYGFASGSIANEAADSSSAPALGSGVQTSIYVNNSAVVLGEEQVFPYGETPNAGWLPSLGLVDPGTSTPSVGNYICTPTVTQRFGSEAYLVPAIEAIYGGRYNPTATSTTGPVATLGTVTGGAGYTNGNYTNVPLTGGTGSGATAAITVAGGIVTGVTLQLRGVGYTASDGLSAPTSVLGSGTLFKVVVSTINTSLGTVSNATDYTIACGLANGDGRTEVQSSISLLSGVYFDVITTSGVAPDGSTSVVSGDRIAVIYNGSTYSWVVVPADSRGGDMSSVAQVCYGAQVEMSLTPEQTPPSSLWNFDAITSTEIMDNALRGVGFNGEPQATFIEAGVDNVNRMYEDSQSYFNPLGFIAYYGSYIQNASGQFIPPSPYVTGVAIRRYRAEGFQFPPAGVKYQLADAIGVQIPVNSAQQNLLNPDGCNVVRNLPGYPDTAVFIWGGRTRVNKDVADQRKFQFVNTRVIQNVVYGSLRNAFDNQIFSVIDGFGVIYNQITSIGNSVLIQLWSVGALFGARPSDAFQVICDGRNNSAQNLENGLVNVKVFDVPVPTLERIEVDLIRVSIGQMGKELESQGLS